MRLGKLPHRDGQRADVVVMAVGDDDGVEVFLRDERQKRHAFATFAFGMGAGVEQDTVAFDFDKPGAGSNVGVGIQVNDSHGGE